MRLLQVDEKLLKTMRIEYDMLRETGVLLTDYVKINSVKNMDSFGLMVRKLREDRALPLRTVSAFLEIDQAILSKIERGQRQANRALVVKLAEYFKVSPSELLVFWLADKLVYTLDHEEEALNALKVAEEKVRYNRLKLE
jgi:transcriptional regulator with XRE-family HTH domain